jgi:hypothetical protein
MAYDQKRQPSNTEDRVPVSIDNDIDQLYQVPLAEFTAARNALAARAGARAADIRRLPKPNAAAWAVNQLHWRRPKTRDRLETASRRLREAHTQQLAGKSADVPAAESAHRAAVAAALDEARTRLEESGDAATPATLQAVAETLETVMWRPLDGRLARPLKRTGLEALTALKGGAVTGGRGRPAEILAFTPSMRPRTTPPTGGTAADAAERQRERERRDLTRDRQKARDAERDAQKALAIARRRVEAAERERARLTDALEAITAALQDHRADVDRARKAAEQTTAERQRLDDRLATVDANHS